MVQCLFFSKEQIIIHSNRFEQKGRWVWYLTNILVIAADDQAKCSFFFVSVIVTLEKSRVPYWYLYLCFCLVLQIGLITHFVFQINFSSGLSFTFSFTYPHSANICINSLSGSILTSSKHSSANLVISIAQTFLLQILLSIVIPYCKPFVKPALL